MQLDLHEINKDLSSFCIAFYRHVYLCFTSFFFFQIMHEKTHRGAKQRELNSVRKNNDKPEMPEMKIDGIFFLFSCVQVFVEIITRISSKL